MLYLLVLLMTHGFLYCVMRVREGEVKNRCRALRGEPHLLFSLSALEKNLAVL